MFDTTCLKYYIKLGGICIIRRKTKSFAEAFERLFMMILRDFPNKGSHLNPFLDVIIDSREKYHERIKLDLSITSNPNDNHTVTVHAV